MVKKMLTPFYISLTILLVAFVSGHLEEIWTTDSLKRHIKRDLGEVPFLDQNQAYNFLRNRRGDPTKKYEPGEQIEMDFKRDLGEVPFLALNQDNNFIRSRRSNPQRRSDGQIRMPLKRHLAGSPITVDGMQANSFLSGRLSVANEQLELFRPTGRLANEQLELFPTKYTGNLQPGVMRGGKRSANLN